MVVAAQALQVLSTAPLGVGDPATWELVGEDDELTKYDPSRCFRDTRPKTCPKTCCVLPPGPPLGHNEKAKALTKHRASLRQVVKTLRPFHALADTILSEPMLRSLGPQDGPPLLPEQLLFPVVTVAQQVMIRVDFGFFANFSERAIRQLCTSGRVHPDTLTKYDLGLFDTHSANIVHLMSPGTKSNLQKFVVLARAGEIVSQFNVASKYTSNLRLLVFSRYILTDCCDYRCRMRPRRQGRRQGSSRSKAPEPGVHPVGTKEEGGGELSGFLHG